MMVSGRSTARIVSELMITDLERNILMSSVYVTHIVWA